MAGWLLSCIHTKPCEVATFLESPALIFTASSPWLSFAQCGRVGQSRDFGARQSVVQITVWAFTSWVTLGKVLPSHKPHFPHVKMDLIFCRDVVRIEFYAYLYICLYISYSKGIAINTVTAIGRYKYRLYRCIYSYRNRYIVDIYIDLDI